jgi:hypothetical protein
MSCGSIYKIPFPNGKYYIGLTTTSLEQRTKEHRTCAKSGNNKCLYNAIRKYDMVNNFELIEIDTADTTDELCEKEIGYIIEYNSYYMNGRGYNMTYGGEGTNGYVFTEDDNRKNSERQNKYHEEHPEMREEQRIRTTMYFGTPGAKQKQSDALCLYYAKNEGAIQKNRDAQIKSHEDNPDMREEQRKRKIQYFIDHPEKKQEYGKTMKEYYKNHPEAIQKARDATIQHNKDNPNTIKKHSAKMKEHYKDNPDARRKVLDGKGKNKPFDIFTIEGTFIKTFTYQFDAREYLQKEHHITSTIKISEVLSGKRNNSAGFVFKYK